MSALEAGLRLPLGHNDIGGHMHPTISWAERASTSTSRTRNAMQASMARFLGIVVAMFVVAVRGRAKGFSRSLAAHR